MNARLKHLMLFFLALWAASSAYADRPATQAEREAAGFDDPSMVLMVRDTPAAAPSGMRSPDGGASTDWQTRFGVDFTGRTSDIVYGFAAPPSFGCDSGTERFATTAFDLPNGAVINFVDIFGFDANASDNLISFFYSVCQSAPGTPITTELQSVSSSGSGGNFLVTMDFTASPITVDRYSCHYLLRVNLASSSSTCSTTIGIDKARVEFLKP